MNMTMPPQAYPMKFLVPVVEFQKHLKARSEHHRQRARHYATEAERLDNELKAQIERGQSVTEQIEIKTSSSYDNATHQRGMARSQMQTHSQKAREFAWYAAHLDHTVASVYLSTNEAQLFEMTEA
jgi:hypothetical protein